MKKALNEAQLACLRQAAKRFDGSVLAIGFNLHNPEGDSKSHAMATARSLERRGLLFRFGASCRGTIFKLTAPGWEAAAAAAANAT